MLRTKKSAFVTGGSRGIGSGIVYALAMAGINVAFTFNTNLKAAKLVEKNSKKFNGAVLAIPMDMSSNDSISNAVNLAQDKFSGIDILINNAAISQEKPFQKISESDWEKMMKINLQAPFTLIQHFIPYMKRNKWGRIVNISSIGGQWGGFNQVHYAASKAGLINLTRSIARIYSSYGITSNVITPGLIDTDMSSDELRSAKGKEKIKNIPAQRIGNIADVGSAVAFLVTENASYITGQTININGGMFFSA